MRARRAPAWRTILAAALLVIAGQGPFALAGSGPVLSVEAGAHTRKDAPVRVVLAGKLVEPPASARRDDEPYLVELRDGMPFGPQIRFQIDEIDGDPEKRRASWILGGETAVGATRTFRLEFGPPIGAQPRPWSCENRSDGSLELKNRLRTVFRYNYQPVKHPNYGGLLVRNAYIHPAFSPAGALVTGDFSKAHSHHRGFFLAYAHTKVGNDVIDFWNIQRGLGRIVCDHLGKATVGPVSASFSAEHNWEAKGKGVVLRERWNLEIFDIPGSPYWLFDLSSTQRATDAPVELTPYRYGGMAYRGPDPFLPLGKVDALTSDGLDRKQGDQKPARWVDLTGPVDDGSTVYAGAAILDHPANVNHPTIARIHPTTLPFFSFVPAHDSAVTIGKDSPTVFRYRILIHDGHPDPALDERLWRDFSEPPLVRVVEARP
jgi:hypothetical protein